MAIRVSAVRELFLFRPPIARPIGPVSASIARCLAGLGFSSGLVWRLSVRLRNCDPSWLHNIAILPALSIHLLSQNY
ncbi:hypothetical protein EX30DRAFT_341616 [Ascodesmis nigricans]|uniref:Uncharacterized protein n=1 Tax=Ascodesmis nigricans TaxID=341454 RepID=A0A4S2MUX6_9PEZI|nr:hypothetical protein EX30DRAFT_341616 [Ascodesmis nigricans]